MALLPALLRHHGNTRLFPHEEHRHDSWYHRWYGNDHVRVRALLQPLDQDDFVCIQPRIRDPIPNVTKGDKYYEKQSY